MLVYQRVSKAKAPNHGKGENEGMPPRAQLAPDALRNKGNLASGSGNGSTEIKFSIAGVTNYLAADCRLAGLRIHHGIRLRQGRSRSSYHDCLPLGLMRPSLV
jgi:hypothetical protein